MRPEKDEELCKKYPILYSQRDRSMMDTCMCWGFECRDGWFSIIDWLSETLEGINNEILDDQKRQYKLSKRLGAVGGLFLGFSMGSIFFSHTPLVPILAAIASIILVWKATRLFVKAKDRHFIVAEQVKEKFGTLRFYIGPVEADYYDLVYEWIDVAEVRSGTTCEACGKTGKTRNGGWTVTLCDECHEKKHRS